VRADTEVARSAKAASAAALVAREASNQGLRAKVGSRVGRNVRVALANQAAQSVKADSVGAPAAKAVDLLAQAVQSAPADLATDQRETVDRAAVASKSGD
jgi:hypothetical protein